MPNPLATRIEHEGAAGCSRPWRTRSTACRYPPTKAALWLLTWSQPAATPPAATRARDAAARPEGRSVSSQIIVIADSGDRALWERLTPADCESVHFNKQLVERIAWDVLDNTDTETRTRRPSGDTRGASIPVAHPTTRPRTGPSRARADTTSERAPAADRPSFAPAVGA